MELEKQVVSLELAKKLKELGVKQKSFFGWVDGLTELLDGYFLSCDSDRYEYSFSAFTVAELGEMLPRPLWNGRLRHRFGFDEDGWYIELIWKDTPGKKRPFGSNTLHATTEADARAKMLIYLIENGLVD